MPHRLYSWGCILMQPFLLSSLPQSSASSISVSIWPSGALTAATCGVSHWAQATRARMQEACLGIPCQWQGTALPHPSCHPAAAWRSSSAAGRALRMSGKGLNPVVRKCLPACICHESCQGVFTLAAAKACTQCTHPSTAFSAITVRSSGPSSAQRSVSTRTGRPSPCMHWLLLHQLQCAPASSGPSCVQHLAVELGCGRHVPLQQHHILQHSHHEASAHPHNSVHNHCQSLVMRKSWT